MKKWMIVILFLFLASSVDADNSSMALFFKGNEAYKEQNYKEAVRLYEDVLKQGEVNGELYFNLGNAYYKQGHLGKAILNYRRAKRFIPRDSDVEFNLRYAQESVQRFERPQLNFVEKLIQGHIHFYSEDEMILVITWGFFGLGVVFLLSRFFKWSKNIRYLSRGLFLITIFVFMVGYILKIQEGKDKAVLLMKTPAYFEPVEGSTEHFQLFEGGSIQILKEEGGWLKVRRSDGLLGWVPQEAAERI